jgi:hypothetical protein
VHSLNRPDAATFPGTLDLHVADVKVRVEAPERVISLLNMTLSNVPRFDANHDPDFTIAVVAHADMWEVRGIDGSRCVLALQSAMPQVGGAVVTLAVTDIAASCAYRTMRAAVIERNGRALAMIGDDWESAITLATHFHGRGWRYVGCDHALFDPVTHRMLAIQKSIYVNASSVSLLPTRYRRAVELSPWYVTPRGISFYAVDPTQAGMQQTWTAAGKLCGVIVVDGAMADIPALDWIDAKRRHEGRFAGLGIDGDAIGIAELRIGGYIETCDLIEQWFASLSP